MTTDNSPLEKGYKRTEVGLIPEDWTPRRLGDDGLVHRVGSGITPTGGQRVYKQSGRPFIRSQNVGWGELRLDDLAFIDERTHASFSGSEIVEGDVLLNITGASIGRCAVANAFLAKGNVNQHVCEIRTNKKKLDAHFLSSYLLSDLGQSQIDSFQAGGNRQGLNFHQIRTFVIPVPNLVEQRAIAEALSDVDGLIAALDKVIAKKRAIKQAAMQQLLTGKTRLPGFSHPWETKQLGEIALIQKGQLITESTLVLGTVPVVAGGRQPAYFHNRPNRAGKTVTISASGANAGFVAFWKEPIFASDCSTISESPNFSIEYIFYQLVLQQETVYRSQTGGAQPHVHAKDLAPLQLPLPPLAEQTAIATILSHIDAEIAALGRRRDKTRQIKQGIMQQLLSGRIRLIKTEQNRSIEEESNRHEYV